MIRFSANLGFLWPDLPLLDRIDAAARAGFGAVELHWPYDTPPDAVRERCVAGGLALLSVNTSRGDAGAGELGVAALPGRERDFEAHLAQAVEWCVAAGGIAVHVMAGRPGGDLDDRRAAVKALVRNLRAAAGSADAAGLTLLLEALNPHDAPGYLYSRVDEVAEVIGVVDRPNVRLMFDVYHVAVGEGDVLRKFERLMPLIGHVQIAAAPSRAEPDEGEIAFDRVLRAFAALGYDGWVGCEYRPRASTDEGLAWRERLGFASGPG
jgi:hydroxypyruvate isomerase